MKTVKYIPEGCKGEKPEFAGSVELIPVTFDEKFSYLEELGLDVDENGALVKNTSKQLKAMRNLVKLSEKHYASVSLKKLSTGEEVKSFQEMSIDSDYHMMMIEIANQIIGGIKLGNG